MGGATLVLMARQGIGLRNLEVCPTRRVILRRAGLIAVPLAVRPILRHHVEWVALGCPEWCPTRSALPPVFMGRQGGGLVESRDLPCYTGPVCRGRRGRP